MNRNLRQQWQIVSVQWPDDSSPTLFQVEIKNWSAHSKGGKRLAANAPLDQVAHHKMERWAKEWDEAKGQPSKKETVKILLPIRAARPGKVEPVLCLWDAMRPTGHGEPWLCVDLPDGNHFGRLWVLSMSSYLRSLDSPFTLYRSRDAGNAAAASMVEQIFG